MPCPYSFHSAFFCALTLGVPPAVGRNREGLCEGIREFDRETPILFFSGTHPMQQREALTFGAQGFVMKPDFEGLRRGIGQALGVAS